MYSRGFRNREETTHDNYAKKLAKDFVSKLKRGYDMLDVLEDYSPEDLDMLYNYMSRLKISPHLKETILNNIIYAFARKLAVEYKYDAKDIETIIEKYPYNITYQMINRRRAITKILTGKVIENLRKHQIKSEYMDAYYSARKLHKIFFKIKGRFRNLGIISDYDKKVKDNEIRNQCKKECAYNSEDYEECYDRCLKHKSHEYLDYINDYFDVLFYDYDIDGLDVEEKLKKLLEETAKMYKREIEWFKSRIKYWRNITPEKYCKDYINKPMGIDVKVCLQKRWYESDIPSYIERDKQKLIMEIIYILLRYATLKTLIEYEPKLLELEKYGFKFMTGDEFFDEDVHEDFKADVSSFIDYEALEEWKEKYKNMIFFKYKTMIPLNINNEKLASLVNNLNRSINILAELHKSLEDIYKELIEKCYNKVEFRKITPKEAVSLISKWLKELKRDAKKYLNTNIETDLIKLLNTI